MRYEVGEILRDCQYDRGSRTGLDLTKRTVRVLQVDEQGVLAVTVTDHQGRPAARPVRRRISRDTLIAQYEHATVS